MVSDTEQALRETDTPFLVEIHRASITAFLAGEIGLISFELGGQCDLVVRANKTSWTAHWTVFSIVSNMTLVIVLVYGYLSIKTIDFTVSCHIEH